MDVCLSNSTVFQTLIVHIKRFIYKNKWTYVHVGVSMLPQAPHQSNLLEIAMLIAPVVLEAQMLESLMSSLRSC